MIDVSALPPVGAIPAISLGEESTEEDHYIVPRLDDICVHYAIPF